jgi:hypothetical protein
VNVRRVAVRSSVWLGGIVCGVLIEYLAKLCAPSQANDPELAEVSH